MINLIPLGFASFMALLDAIVFSWIKQYSIGALTSIWLLPVGMFIYSLQPLLLLKSLKYETMTIMNIMWNMVSNVTVTAMGLFYFKEKLTLIKMAGLFFAFVSISLLSYEESKQT